MESLALEKPTARVVEVGGGDGLGVVSAARVGVAGGGFGGGRLEDLGRRGGE